MAERDAEIEALESELRGLGRVLAIAPPLDVIGVVMSRLEREPAPGPAAWWQRLLAAASTAGRWLRERWRIGTAVLAGMLLVLLAVTAAGAAVRQWLGFGAVVVVQEQAPPTAAPSPAVSAGRTASGPDSTEMTVAQARAAVSFPVGVPASLGPPTLVALSGDARVVSMTWSDGVAIQLDQIGGAADPFFVKKYYSDIEFTQVRGGEALWLIRPHPIVVLAPDGTELVESARQSGPALTWQNSGVTLRLEGVADRERAVSIAESVAP